MMRFGALNRALGLSIVASVSAVGADRQVAVTFDDLPGPGGGLVSTDVPFLRENTRKLLASFKEHNVPVVGFVNEGKLFRDGETPVDADARKQILALWTDGGFELGNHTYSHYSLARTPLAEFEQDVLRGETVTRALLADHGKTLRYFRHPYLNVGLDLGKRLAFETFLRERGYTVAPVTMDNDEYMYASVYADAVRREDSARAQKVADDYVRYMDTTFAFAEDVALRLAGREMRHTLLLHANTLNADLFSRIAEVLKNRGYRFVTLEEALKDEVYASPDTYVGESGLSWLTHWELTAGKKRTAQPDPPGWLLAAYKSLTMSP